jgi:uncharacterized protein
MNVFSVPVRDKFLVYAPLHRLIALVNRQALPYIRAGLNGEGEIPEAVQPLVDRLRAPGESEPGARTGGLIDPYFLGIIPTRGCNMACRYCDFAAPKQSSPVMDVNLAREAVDAYFRLLQEVGNRRAEVHFFGGEPFAAESVVHFVVACAAKRAAELGQGVRFEVTTNGLYSPSRCQWIADHFDTVVLSLDGLAEVQDRHRPALNGRGTFEVVARSARIFSEGPCELVVRACVTQETIADMPEFARWIGQELRASTVCFESLSLSPLAQTAGFAPPDPWEFAVAFDCAGRILDAYGIEAVLSTADLRTNRSSFCPVGKDALIVSPDGAIDACYLLREDWERKGLDMRLGRIAAGRLEIDPAALQRVRDLTVRERPLCAGCLCRYQCAGGCHVNHDAAGKYDDLCVQTRLVTLTKLLRQIGQDELAETWLADRRALEKSVWQASDRLEAAL